MRVVFNPFTGTFDFVLNRLGELRDVGNAVSPTVGSLLVGDGTVFDELGVGPDGAVLTADSGQALGVSWTSVAGVGDVVGPASATDEALVRFDGPTGKLVQNSNALLTDAGDLTLVGTFNGVRHYASSATDPAVPAPADGDRYYNTSINEEMRYDGSRSKWLSVSGLSIQSGRNGNTGVNRFYRGVNGMTLNAGDRGFSVPQGTLVYLAMSRTDSDAATLEILVNGVVIATLLTNASGSTLDLTVNADHAAGLLSFRNQAGGNTTSNVQIVAITKRRV